jgi:hypothetical protein
VEYFAAIDVSLELSSVWWWDGTGKIVCEKKVASEPEALAAFFRGSGLILTRIGFGGRSAVAMAACRADGGGASGDLDLDQIGRGHSGQTRPLPCTIRLTQCTTIPVSRISSAIEVLICHFEGWRRAPIPVDEWRPYGPHAR